VCFYLQIYVAFRLLWRFLSLTTDFTLTKNSCAVVKSCKNLILFLGWIAPTGEVVSSYLFILNWSDPLRLFCINEMMITFSSLRSST